MSPRYRLWFLIGCVCVLLWMNLRESVLEVVLPAQTNPGNAQARKPALTSDEAHTRNPTAVPTGFMDRPLIESASHNPFLPEAPPVLVPKFVVAPAPVVQVSPEPVAPPLNLQFVGRTVSGDGGQTVYVMLGESSLRLRVDDVLPNGYRVDVINADYAELVYPILNTRVRFEFPVLPKHEMR